MTTDGVELTDDEVLGLARLTGRRWRVVTPTVDVTNPSLLASAAARGVRSLAVRGFLDVDGDEVEVGRDLTILLRAALEGDVLVSMFNCAPDFAFDPHGVTVAVFAEASGACSVDSVSAVGVHTLVQYDAEQARSVVLDAIGAATRTAAQGGAGAVGVVLGGNGQRERRVYRFADDQVSSANLETVEKTDDPETVLRPVTRLSFDTALGQVFAAV